MMRARTQQATLALALFTLALLVGACGKNSAKDFWQAAGKGDSGALAQLLPAGGVDARETSSGRTALQEAVEGGQIESVQTLLSMGANPTAVSQGGLSCLEIAVLGGHAEIVAVLLKAGAMPESPLERRRLEMLSESDSIAEMLKSFPNE